MKKLIYFLAGLFLLCVSSVASAQYFMSGGLGYNILSPITQTVEVTGSDNCSVYSGNINIPATVTHNGITYDVVALGEYAFYEAALSGITIPTSVTQIKEGCFRDVTGLTSINVPTSVTDIELWAFAAVGLTNINVDETNPNYCSIDGILFSKDTTTLVECPRGKRGTINLPQNTRYIDPCAFFDCKTITDVTLPEGLSSIGFWAFMGANRLNNIVIPSSVSYIGDNLFGGCSALANLTLETGNTHYYLDGMMIYSAGGDTLVSAHRSADSVFLPNTVRVVSGFGFNSRIKYVHVPEGVTTIADNAFAESSLRSIDLPSHLERIKCYAFDYCTSLVRVDMPTTLDTMELGCFEGCSRLTSIDLPNGLRTIPREAFMFCTSLAHINWGDSIETIDEFAFGNCALSELQLPPSLRVVRPRAFWKGRKMNRVVFSAPIDTIEWGAFDEHPIRTLQLKNTLPPVTTEYGYDDMNGCLAGTTVDSIIIPCGSREAYLADDYWGQFSDKYYEDCNGIDVPRESELSVYPNPATDHIIVQGLRECQRVELVNTLGQTVLSRNIVGDTLEIDVRGLERGIYFLRFHTAECLTTSKIILQ